MTTSIVLTIFQTNLHEAKAYLDNNNPTYGLALFYSAFVITGYLHFLQHMAAASSEQKWNHKWLAFFLLLLLVSGGKGIAKVRYEAVTSLFSQTKQSLAQYKAYTAAKKQRAENLEKLQNLSVDPRKKGILCWLLGNQLRGTICMRMATSGKRLPGWISSEKTGKPAFYSRVFQSYPYGSRTDLFIDGTEPV